ncbi:MAG: LysR family transcriptional regulator [Verrucomicrobiales bacterium]|nr:LysR family transcriptional regulator [Verrucomicrobiales bacterium]
MEILDSRQLRAFQEVAHQGSFTSAAVELSLTQSAVSHSLKALEGDLEVQLIQRAGKDIQLTEAGQILLGHAEKILQHMKEAREGIRALGLSEQEIETNASR